jgi:GDSL-like Lipase/Acylhydrolase family
VVGGLRNRAENQFRVASVRKVLAIVLALGALGTVATGDTGRHGPPLYAYGTSYLADDTTNTAGHRYIEQLSAALRPSEFHNFGKNGATVDQVADSVDATWRARHAIVVVDALTNSLVQTRADPSDGIAEAEPVFRSMLERFGPAATVLVVKQGYFSAEDYAIINHEMSDATVDAWNAMIDRAAVGLSNVHVIDPNALWDANTMMTSFHPNDSGQNHIAQLLFQAAGLAWKAP